MENITCLESQNAVSFIIKPMLILDFIFGLPGNVFALWIFFFKSPWKASNLYLFSLVVADFLLLFGLPFHIHDLFLGKNCVFGERFCQFVLYITSVGWSASMAFMSILAVDRFFRITHPHHCISRMRVRKSTIIVGAVWVGISLLHLPPALDLALNSQENSSNITVQCHSLGSLWKPKMKIYFSVQMIEALLAFIVTLFCFVRVVSHVRGRSLTKVHRRVKRCVRLLLLLTIMSFLFFLPTAVLGLTLQVYPCSRKLLMAFHVSSAVSYIKSALDPVIYCHSNAWYRDTFKSKSNSSGLTNFKMSDKTKRKRRH